MASSKRAVRQEDTNLTKLREIGARLENKTCFDCGQKGPTYVNTTIGSFVCTHCSGLLRGLTPPHRVKSISMASFTPEELDNLSKHGNHFCRGVWLGSYDEKLGYPDFKDEHKVRDFMIAKYEKKKYYVDPSIVERLEKTSPKSGAKPLASLVPQVSPLNVRGTNSTPSASAFDAWKTTPKSNADSGGVKPKFDPFGSLPNTPTHSAISQPNFADFDNNPVFQTAASHKLKETRLGPTEPLGQWGLGSCLGKELLKPDQGKPGLGRTPEAFLNPDRGRLLVRIKNSAGPAPAKSTNPFVANGGNAELVDSFAWAQIVQSVPVLSALLLLLLFESSDHALLRGWYRGEVAPMANPWGGAMQHQSGVPLSMSVPMAMSSGSQLGGGSGGGFGNSQTVFGNPWNASGFATGGGSFMGSTPNPFAMEQRLTTGTTAPTTSKNNPFL
ncbi:unnamed protein product [Notodromas monacha]|uniref:Arf-GAP domain-containing protein n=1 Tax=Notodromas monacha TaxID=399045 RepID=A0A7R9BJB6_9CRUS|nr:unnamed protein product [Notodromas monacha]CAG0916565.1 unnamed protein product [Notodromas monacha]